jgi:CAAX protease family protein
MPGSLDVALIVLFAAVWPLVEYFSTWPRHVRAVDAGDANARSRAYVRMLWEQWLFAAAVVAVMLGAGRPLSVLCLHLPHGWRLWLGAALPMVYGVLLVTQGRALAAKPASLAKLRVRLQPLRALVPHTAGEFRLFVPLSITAGICEELLFRGFLLWYATMWTGPVGGFLISSALFGVMHVYLGVKQVPRSAFVGIYFYVIAMAAGSLLPAMLCHAITDLVSGDLGYRALATDAAGDGVDRAAGDSVADSEGSARPPTTDTKERLAQ